MKKPLTLLLVLASLLLTATAFAEPLVLSVTSANELPYAFMTDYDGTPLNPPYTYSFIYEINDTPSDKRFYCAAPYDPVSLLPEGTVKYETYDGVEYPTSDTYDFYNVALLDENGVQLTDFLYNQLTYYPDCDVITYVDSENRCGALDLQGNALLSGSYAWLTPNGRGGWLAMQFDERSKDKLYDQKLPLVYIDPNGRAYKTDFTMYYWMCGVFKDGLCPVYSGGEAPCFYLNAEGAKAFDREFEYVSDFQNGCAIVCDQSNYYGLIDTKGNNLLEPVFLQIARHPQDEGAPFLCITQEKELELYDAQTYQYLYTFRQNGEKISYAYYNNDLISASGALNEYTFTEDGEILSRYAYSGQNNFYYDYYFASFEGETERVILNRPYDAADPGSYIADLQGKAVSEEYNYITGASWNNGEGRYIVQAQAPRDNRNGYRFVGKYGICDENGNVLVDTVYDSLQYIAYNRYLATLGDTYLLIDSHGNELIEISPYVNLLD